MVDQEPDEWGSAELQHLLDAAVAGNPDAWGRLLEQFRLRLKSHASQWLGAHVLEGDGSDIVQMVFEQALRDRGQFRGRSVGEFAAWLFAIEHHTLIGHRRHHQRKKRDGRRVERGSTPLGNLVDHGTSASQQAIQGEQRRRLSAAIEQLDAVYRDVLRMQYLEARSSSEISELLGLTPGQVANRIRQGTAILKKELGAE